MALATLFRRHRGPSALERADLERYDAEIRPLTRRVLQIRDAWLAEGAQLEDVDRRANQAAVNRWELLRLVEQMETVSPPPCALAIHRAVIDLVTRAARASQLLARGYRTSRSDDLCDGQDLFVESVAALEDRLEALAADLAG